MISPIEDSDLPVLREILAVAIRANVAEAESESLHLIADVEQSLSRWTLAKTPSHHRKHVLNGMITGFVIVKDFWNLSHLFVLPQFQNQGIGRELIESALKACCEKSRRGKIQLNSSRNAIGFYEAMGFQQTGGDHKEVSGCLPFEYVFESH